VHGCRFALFKCASCCDVATWHCYSHHYCERCHNQASEPKHYPCPGPDKCPLGMLHPPNGEGVHCSKDVVSFCIGCAACMGCADEDGAAHTSFSHDLVMSFEEKWKKFANGSQVLATFGETEVRKQLEERKRQLGESSPLGSWSAERCSSELLSMGLESYRKLVAQTEDAMVAHQLPVNVIELVDDMIDDPQIPIEELFEMELEARNDPDGSYEHISRDMQRSKCASKADRRCRNQESKAASAQRYCVKVWKVDRRGRHFAWKVDRGRRPSRASCRLSAIAAGEVCLDAIC